MAFDINNFALAAGAELSADTKMPLLFTYNAGLDSVQHVLQTIEYFGPTPGLPGTPEKNSISSIVNRGSIIMVSSLVASGSPAPGRYEAMLVVVSQRNEAVAVSAETIFVTI